MRRAVLQQAGVMLYDAGIDSSRSAEPGGDQRPCVVTPGRAGMGACARATATRSQRTTSSRSRGAVLTPACRAKMA